MFMYSKVLIQNVFFTVISFYFMIMTIFSQLVD